jgi:hypothetical protein
MNMTEDYLRRLLPNKWQVEVKKIEERTKANIISVNNFLIKKKCGDLCFQGFDGNNLNKKEEQCLDKCLYKGLEMLSFYQYEMDDIRITKAKILKPKPEKY